MLMIIPRILVAALLPGLLISHAALADSVTVNISGNVVASPCTVESSSPISVVLPDIDMAKLSAKASTSAAESFELKLKDCPASTTKVIATYSGTAATLSADSFINGGTATQVVLWVKDGDDKTINPNTTRTATIDSKTQKASFKQTVQLYSMGAAQPGTVSGNIVVSFTYQ
ncbi:fimbrial protein [Serratia quinivorans]|jgi:minor fimbrial subunit|uniref:fimbrial protein n=1 Tax=Serratia quinivorans TaxID=137545 RepID=UPI00217AA07D|nr:fimbrial protein [Serratia quinivorans]CAI0939639.1 putative fimbrial protein SthD [Serratia quinivorans]CAI2074576.1 putative fimbrial protein SthD [Serratia quinivorans]CAI2093279.1 putative fimbrial protein SthD [Serratia quinivorans]CAI2095952.1 putative fimbrial protein SthD [Serratia quinivorans]